MPLKGLLADMRRKYQHALALNCDPSWLKGEPLTAAILERWIPQVEAVQAEIERLSSNPLPFEPVHFPKAPESSKQSVLEWRKQEDWHALYVVHADGSAWPILLSPERMDISNAPELNEDQTNG